MDRAQALQQQILSHQQHQHQLLGEIQKALHDASHGHPSIAADASVEGLKSQIRALGLLSQTRSYAERLARTAEQGKQLERQVRHASQAQDALQLAELAPAAAERFAECSAEADELAGSSNAGDGVPQELHEVGQQLRERLQSAQWSLRQALSQHIQSCLTECGWPPPLTSAQAGAAQFDPGQMFSPAHAGALNTLQHLMKALTQLQLAADKGAITAALEYQSSSGADVSGLIGPEPPLLWMAQELAAPLQQQVVELFGPSTPGSPGDINTPDILVGLVHRLALENAPRVGFLQGVLQSLELHTIYQVEVEFTRALREAVKQLLRQYKLPEVAAAGSPELWLKYVDALITFEAILGRSALLGVQWDINGEQGKLPFSLLRGSVLTVLEDDPAWMDAWLEAESTGAGKQVEDKLYRPEGWEPGTLLVAEDGPAWQAEAWPPQAAEEVVALVQDMLNKRLPFMPSPAAQERFLKGAVAEVLSLAHGRIERILHQADLFKNITGRDWLFKVCPCICFCNYVESQLQEIHNSAEITVAKWVEAQRPAQQKQQQQGEQSGQLQQQPLANGHSDHSSLQPWQPQQKQQGEPHLANGNSSSNGNGGLMQQQQQRRQSEACQDLAAMTAAATTKLRVLERPIGEFSSCRQEWVLKLGKAVAVGFMQKASGYVSRGALFKVTSDALPAMAAEGELYSSGVVSGELQVALAWLSQLLQDLSEHLDKHCFRMAYSAAAAAINRELFNNVACEAYFSDAGALQLLVDQRALLSVFARYTARPAAYFRELVDAAKLLALPQQQAEFVRQAVSSSSRAQNAVEVLKSAGVHNLDPDLAETVMSLRVYN